MPRLKKPGRSGAALMAAMLGLFWLSSVSCKSPTSSTTATITVINSCGATIILYLDGTQKATVESGSSDTLESITVGSHLIEAKKSDTGVLVSSKTVTVTAGAAVSVTIPGPASLRVTNQYGELLSIYLDGTYLGDIGDQITQTVLSITFGTHVFTAETKTSTTVVATVTINVTDVTTYTWTITQ
ncbi:MAG: hypothetical protein ABR951_01615 [Candidatus Aminicenantales bacterium]|jgi:hypothetical protein